MAKIVLSAILGALVWATVGAGLAVGDSDPQATASDPTDVLGVWAFQTKPYRDGTCVMTGRMHLSSNSEDGIYDCELTALEKCSVWGQSLVRQSCTARRFGNQVSVRSNVEEVLERKSEIEGMIFNYVPDNFALTVQSSQRMYGALVSAVTAPVEFRRSDEGVS
ncbi:MAG: hypothetical protein AAF216_12240 [Pseudomonadota bacterium]